MFSSPPPTPHTHPTRLLRKSLLNPDTSVFSYYAGMVNSGSEEVRAGLRAAADLGDPESNGDTPLMEVIGEGRGKGARTAVYVHTRLLLLFLLLILLTWR